jgi:hypothetical protein
MIRVIASEGSKVLASGDFTCEISADRFYEAVRLRYLANKNVKVTFCASPLNTKEIA